MFLLLGMSPFGLTAALGKEKLRMTHESTRMK